MPETDEQQHSSTPGAEGNGTDGPGSPGALIERAAEGQLAPEEADYLTAYFLGGKTLAPGQDPKEYLKREVNIGSDTDPKYQRFTFRTVEWEQWQTAQQEGTVRRMGNDTVDPFRRASYTAAYACVEPSLGQLRTRIPEEWEDADGQKFKRPADTAELLRFFFRLIPGALIDIENEVLRASKLLTAESAVREVAAAGN